MQPERIYSFSITAISGVVFCLMVGLIFYQEKIFFTSHHAFWFVSFGIIGSFYFTTLKFSKLINAITVLFILTFFSILVFSILYNVSSILMDALLVFGLAISIYVYFKFFLNKYKGMKLTRSILLGLTSAIIFMMITILLLLINLIPLGGVKEVYTNIAFGFLIGFGLGLGFELAEDIKRKLKI